MPVALPLHYGDLADPPNISSSTSLFDRAVGSITTGTLSFPKSPLQPWSSRLVRSVSD